MDIWENGRQELAEELKKICNRIGANLAAELDHDINAFIPRDKLKTLREKAAKADEFEDEVSSLNRQKRSLEAKLGEGGAVTEKNAEINRLVEHNARLAEELETHKNAASRIDELEKENKLLAAELMRVLNETRGIKVIGGITSTPITIASEPPSSAPRSDANGSNNESRVIAKDKYEGLVKKYNTLHENHQLLVSARATLAKALTEKRAKYRCLYGILENQVKTRDATIKEQGEEIQRLKAQLGNGPVESRTSTSRTPDKGGEHIISVEHSEMQNDRASPVELPMLLPGGYNGHDQGVVERPYVGLEPYTTTSELTLYASSREGGAPAINRQPSTESPPSPDTPVVVFSRSIRKTKSRTEPTESSKTPRVKIEPETISSSPIGLVAMLALDESLDLDDIGEKQSTPTKGRVFLKKALRANSSLANAACNETGILHNGYSHRPANSRVSQETPIRGVKRTGSVLQPRSPNTLILPRISAERAKKRRRITSDEAVGALLEDGEALPFVESTPTPDQARLLSDLLSKPSLPNKVLSPFRAKPTHPTPLHVGGGSAVSSRAYEVHRDDPPTIGNLAPPLPRDLRKSKEPADQPRPTSKGSARSIEISRPSSRGSLRSSAEPTRPASRSTFRDSAYGSRPTSRDSPETRPGPSKHFQPSLRTPVQDQRLSRESAKDSVNPQRPSSKGSTRQPKTLKPEVRMAHLQSKEQNDTPSRARIPPLRTLPLEQLTLQDFKVNPKYNQGHSYAFREVVRNQADRRCLPGCTKPDCCGGQFKVLAEALRDPNRQLTLSQEEADDKILEEFLGDNAYKLRNMTKEERDETLILAMARDMANKMGKHRHAYERRQSPPGYWRSDFPNTQEEVQDRAKATELEREQLAQRYQEAMRGGAYIFKDE